MAKPKQTIMVERRSKGYANVYLPDRLVPDLKAIEGITSITSLIGCYLITIDPRYDFDEIVREIENLDAPIPSAFLGDE